MKHIYLSLIAIALLAHDSSAQSTCGNKDFEDQNFNNWTGQTGTNASSTLTWSGGFITTVNDAPLNSSARQTIITVSAIDSVTMDTLLTTLAPNGSGASIRLGNCITGAEAEGVKFQFSPAGSDTVFTYQYACVFEDPGHPLIDQPGFAVNVYDANNVLIPSLSDTIYSGDPQYAFITNFANLIKYKRWSGVSINLAPYIGQTVTIEFNNFDCSYGGHFGYTYLDASCQGTWVSNVWPGDCDYDLTANNIDFLSLGIAYSATGTTRPSASLAWTAQPSADWGQSFQLGANYKHCDTNGDGVVDLADTAAIYANYSSTHPFRLAAPAADPLSTLPPLYLVASTDTVYPLTPVTVDIMLGDASFPANLYGTAFSIGYNNAYIDSASINVSYANSWMGTDGSNMITLEKNFYSASMMDLALTRIDHNNVQGQGKIATLSFVTKANAPAGPLVLGINNVHAVTSTKNPVSLNPSGSTIYYDPNTTAVPSYTFDQLFALYPNPAKDGFSFRSLEGEWSMELLNNLGQQVYSVHGTQGNVFLQPNVKPGVYFARVSCAKGTFVQRVLVTE